MFRYFSLLSIFFTLPLFIFSQPIFDDFEGNGTIDKWVADDCGLNTRFANPFPQGINTSAMVLRYADTGGQYANVRFDLSNNLDLESDHTFSLKIYLSAADISGTQKNQISLKVQNSFLNEPWNTQSEIIKPILLNQWQTITFNFKSDPYINLNPGSLPPSQRYDFNRILLQVNGENNNDKVKAYIDDFKFETSADSDPIYDNLIWSDEFDSNGAIDNTKWFHQTKLPSGGSWYNGEIQHYTNRTTNSVVENGILKIIAKKEIFNTQGQTKNYTSARLNSKFAFTYGKIEVRAKLPEGLGTWPAIWMLGKNITETGAYWEQQGFGTTPWPACGEIDIMEHWGYNQNFVQSALHTPSSFSNTVNLGGQNLPTASSEFHVYGLVWTPEKMTFSVDGMVHYIYRPFVKDDNTWPFNKDQYLILNFAIQPTILPSFIHGEFAIDYVRVYQESPISTAFDISSATQHCYPNPVKDAVTIKLESSKDQVLPTKIFSMDGKLVLSNTYNIQDNSVTIQNLDKLKNGLYFITFELNKKSNFLKIIKE